MAKSKAVEVKVLEAPVIKVGRKTEKLDETNGVLLFVLQDEDNPENVRKFYGKPTVSWKVRLRSSQIYAKKGQGASMAYMLAELLGEETFNELMETEDLDEEDMAAICQHAAKVVHGGAEGKA